MEGPPTPPPDWERPLEGIGAVRADADGDAVPDRVGEEVLVGGRVTAGTGVLRADAVEVYLQDGTGGLRLVFPASAPTILTGDSLLVHGVLGFRSGMAEMVAPNVQTVSAPPRDVTPLRLPLLARPNGGKGPAMEAHEGELVVLEGRVIESDGNRSGSQLMLLSGTDLISAFSYAQRTAPISFEDVQIGDYVRIRGIAAQRDLAAPYTGSYLILPLSANDVRRVGLSPTEYKYGALAVAALLLFALLWAALLRRQVRKRSEALRTSEARYGHLFDAAADPVLVLDLEQAGRVVEANRAAQRALGLRPTGDRADGRPARLSDLAADDQEAAHHLAQADRNGAASGNLDLLGVEGRPIPYEVATRGLREGSESVVVSVARNVEQRRLYEHGLLRSIEVAEAARTQAEEADRLKSAILTNMSHEIRTPLTAIIGFADILSEEVDDDLRDFVGSIQDGGQRLLRTLNDIVDFARLNAERASLEPEPLNVTEVVRDAVAGLAPLARQRGLGLHLQSSAASVPAVHSRSSLERIVTTLVGNAIKFTDQGEVHVTIHHAEAFFAVRVQDTGVGIAEDFLPDLYEAFKQESNGHSRSHEGTGLGLAVVKRLVDLMGGEIRVWSQRGEGTLFEVALPSEAPVPDPPPDPPPIPTVPLPGTLSDLIAAGESQAGDGSPSPHSDVAPLD